MATVNAAPTNEIVTAAGIDVQIRRGGKGPPLLVIHGELGVPGWLDAYASLAGSFDVLVPSLPGYGASSRPDWIMGVRDLAAWITWFARDMGVPTPINVIGCSLGGWIAAEIATIAPQFLNKMVLVGAMGIKPENGEIFDYFLNSARTGLRRAFHQPDSSAGYAKYYGKQWTAEEEERAEQHREMTCRVAWKPYMHSLTLPNLLPSIRTPTLIIWGRQDSIAPLDCGQLYHHSIVGSHLVEIDKCGHMPEIEQPEQFVSTVTNFLSG